MEPVLLYLESVKWIVVTHPDQLRVASSNTAKLLVSSASAYRSSSLSPYLAIMAEVQVPVISVHDPERVDCRSLAPKLDKVVLY
jgi:hypothetical protein